MLLCIQIRSGVDMPVFLLCMVMKKKNYVLFKACLDDEMKIENGMKFFGEISSFKEALSWQG